MKNKQAQQFSHQEYIFISKEIQKIFFEQCQNDKSLTLDKFLLDRDFIVSIIASRHENFGMQKIEDILNCCFPAASKEEDEGDRDIGPNDADDNGSMARHPSSPIDERRMDKIQQAQFNAEVDKLVQQYSLASSGPSASSNSHRNQERELLAQFDPNIHSDQYLAEILYLMELREKFDISGDTGGIDE